MTRFLAVLALLAFSSSAALAAPAVPGRAQMKGDVVKMNDQFHLTGWNYRIKSIRWIPATDAYAQKVASYAGDATAPNGYLVLEVPVKNTQSEQDAVPQLIATAFYNDGTTKDSGPMPYSKAGNPINNQQVYPGGGATAYYVINDVPQPTKDNPLTKMIFKLNANNDPGYPPVYRLMQPVVTPAAAP
jgi:hypothetical protein